MSGARTIAGGRYRLERLLGRGGMAEVYLARDAELDRPVAVKLLSGGGGTEFEQRFGREARLAARLSHPNVVRVFDAGEDGGSRFIVMELVEGESLAQLLKRRRKLPPDEALGLARQACAGLEAAHLAGLVHRDVKPQNLLLGRDGTLKVADFGIARAAEATSLTEHGTLLGTAAYVAPEQAAAEPVTPASDVYSLAAVLYETLTGRTPVEFESLAELAARRRESRIVPVRDLEPAVPPHVESALMRALAREPRYRPQTAAEFSAELAGAPSEAPTEPLAGGPRRYESVPGRATLLWVALAVLGAVVAAVALAFARGGGGQKAPAAPSRIHVEPVPIAATPAGEARNLAEWIRSHSR